MVDPLVEAWRVHDTGLVAVPTRFRRLGGVVRHLRGEGDAWPDAVTLAVVEHRLVVRSAGEVVGAWPVSDVSVSAVSDGPPVTFVLEVPEGAHLLAAATGPATASLLSALS